jgi:hypothetical protein
MWCTSWSWSYGRYSSWIYNYLYNQFISPLKCHGAVYTIQHYVIKVCPWLVTGGCFFLDFFIYKNDRYEITDILLNVVLDTINQPTTSFLSKRENIWAKFPHKYIMLICTYAGSSQSSRMKACTIDNYLE